MPLAASILPIAPATISRTTDFCGNSDYVRDADKDMATIEVQPDVTAVGLASTVTTEGRMFGLGCTENGDVEWVCAYDTASNNSQGRFLPSSCRQIAATPAAARTLFVNAGGICTNPTP